MRFVVAVREEGEAPEEPKDPCDVSIDENTGSRHVTEGSGSSIVSIFSETGDFLIPYRIET